MSELVQILAIKKAYLHSLRYVTDSVVGLLVGKINGTEIEVVDSYPLFHSKILAPTLESAIEIIEAHISDKGLKVVGIYESPIQQGEDISLQSSEIVQQILQKIQEVNYIEPIYIKIFDTPQAEDNQDEDAPEQQILTAIVSKLSKKGDEYQFKKLLGSAQCVQYFEQVKQNISSGDHRKIIDFDTHFEDISLDFSNSFIN